MSSPIPMEVELETGEIVTLTNAQVKFLAAYRESGVITVAAKHAGIDRTNHPRWMNGDFPGYHLAFHEAQAVATDALEAEARRRAVDGVKQYKFTRDGTPITRPGASHDDPDPYYYEYVYSDKLLELMLKAHRPEKFKDRVSQEISGPGGGAIEVTQAMRQMAVANPMLSETMCQALENVSSTATPNVSSDGSDGDTSRVGVDD